MSYGNNSSQPDGMEILEWIVIAVMLFGFWPLGLFLLIRKLNKAKQSRDTSGTSRTSASNTAYTAAPPNVQRNAPDFSAYQTPNVTGSRYHAEPTVHRSSDFSAPKTQPVKPAEAGKKKKRAEAPGAGVLLAAAILFFFIGVCCVLGGISDASWAPVLTGLFFLAGGGAGVLSRRMIKKRASRLNKYLNVLGADDCMSVKEIAEATGLSRKQIKKDLEYMAEHGFFGPDAYFDNGLDSIVISQAAAEKERAVKMAEKNRQKQEEDRKHYTGEYMRAYEEMRDAAQAIGDPVISGKGMQLAELTGKILKAGEEDPNDAPRVRRFTDYYLPSALKLLRSYSTMERQGVNGRNISATKEKISGILDTMIEGYQKQLDQMFANDAMDISSDIDVMETMLKKDGLKEDGMTENAPDGAGGGMNMPLGGH